jgi:hypothetical protein
MFYEVDLPRPKSRKKDFGDGNFESFRVQTAFGQGDGSAA